MTVVGLLYGTQVGPVVEIISCTEVVCTRDEQTNRLIVDGENVAERLNLVQQVSSDYELVGWYTVAQTPTDDEMSLHKQMCDHISNPLMLLFWMSSEDKAIQANLPGLYESISEESGAIHHLVKVPFRMETEDAENTALNHIAKSATSTGDANDNSNKSQVSLQMTQQLNAIDMLHSRTKTICEYLTDVQQGKVSYDPKIVREIANLCDRLPAPISSDYQSQAGTDQNDVLLTMLLATFTKGCSAMNQFSTSVQRIQVEKSMHKLPDVGLIGKDNFPTDW
ncbi:hypothetical protein SARC_06235 [Sphaeroforma arctica JP610]|uniref:COP9 signalosome complex subunit 6 n=1 Tax=Sphaeroforma arctica JP610 TaxID=667725 RepID=A0A0L0FY07_9EUKA|nr:hypothetical protein SARC_06235 [Sphaeroforma arctica JP610]KNC81446.1 hypothetical protein SARC_06235 [Sphaeroforma arctica JP610]|eukprot:XP_014155348.1 hypothetical protein SARC_06235 [Sphaeroforma arctica JP610]